jgi:hypothetical protein
MQTVKLNTPNELNFNDTFGTLPKAKQHQIRLIIHQINHFTIKNGHLGLYHKAYFQFLGCTSKELTQILDLLVQKDIITRLNRGSNLTNQVSKYIMNKPFSIEDSVTTIYDPTVKGTPLFIKKFIADDGKVLSRLESKFVKQKSISTTSVKRNEVTSLKNRVKELEAELAALRASIASADKVVLNENIIESTSVFAVPSENVYTSNTTAIEVEPSFDDLDIYSRKLSTKNFYFMNYSIVKNTVVDEDDEAALLDKLTCASYGDSQCFIYNGKNIKFNKGHVDNDIMIELVN